MRKSQMSPKGNTYPVIVCLLLMLGITSLVAVAQSKTERERKGSEKQSEVQSTVSDQDQDKDKSDEDPQFKGLEYRLVGPFRGGRSLTAAGVPGDPTTYFFGATGGGVWKSSDGAMTWSPVFDKQDVSAIASRSRRLIRM
jgi:hypothetical protein